MARLKGIRVNLDAQYSKFARRIEGILKSQAPRKTGALAQSIRVVTNKDGLQIVLQPIKGRDSYGVYLHAGTGNYRQGPGGRDFGIIYEALQDRPRNPNPGPGKGGIKPRFFLNLTDVVYEQFNDQLAQEFAKQQTAYVQSIIQDAIKL
jgi:hypothetical protein